VPVFSNAHWQEEFASCKESSDNAGAAPDKMI